MCRGDFRVLQQLCERNERLGGLFTIKLLLEEVSLDDVITRFE